MEEKAAQLVAERRLKKRAAEYLEELKLAFHNTLPGNHNPAETILLSYLMTMTDGYHLVEYRPSGWHARPTSGWTTTLGYLVEIGRIIVPFVLECRYGECVRQLAVLIDADRPGLRTPKKQSKESTLLSMGASVILFTPDEIFADPDGCAARIEVALRDISDAVLADSGVIRG